MSRFHEVLKSCCRITWDGTPKCARSAAGGNDAFGRDLRATGADALVSVVSPRACRIGACAKWLNSAALAASGERCG